MDQENKQQIRVALQRAEKDLSDLRGYIDDLSVFLPLAFCAVNSLHLILDVNRAFQDISKYAEMDVIGNEMDILFPDKEVIKSFKENISKSKDRIRMEVILLTKDKNKIPVSISAMARRDSRGNFLGYFLTISDISDVKEFQKKLEEKVQEKMEEVEEKTKEIAESRLALMNILEETEVAWKRAEHEQAKTLAVINSFVDGLLIFDSNGIFLMGNPEAEKLLDTKLGKLEGKRVIDFKGNEYLLSLVDVLLKDSLFNKKVKNDDKKEGFKREEIKVAKDQTIEISIVQTMSKQKKIGMLVGLHNITREKMIEAMKSEFVSIAAHQLRTPLSAIKWTMTMLIDGDVGDLNKQQKEMVEKIYISNERMVRLINDLLNVSRIEEGRYIYKPELAHIEDIMESLLDSYKQEISKRKISLKIQKPKKKTGTIAVDVEKITLVIQNFIDNAMKYSKKGGGIVISIKEINKKIEFSVKDSGVGIPKKQQNRLFGKFFRADNVIRMETEGSGLGLFICKNIIIAHGGDIWFESEENKGSTFYFNLPVTDKKGFESFIKTL